MRFAPRPCLGRFVARITRGDRYTCEYYANCDRSRDKVDERHQHHPGAFKHSANIGGALMASTKWPMAGPFWGVTVGKGGTAYGEAVTRSRRCLPRVWRMAAPRAAHTTPQNKKLSTCAGACLSATAKSQSGHHCAYAQVDAFAKLSACDRNPQPTMHFNAA